MAARIYTNARIGAGGRARLDELAAEAGEHITRSDVIRACLGFVLNNEVAVRAVLRDLRTENHKAEDKANERRHRKAAK